MPYSINPQNEQDSIVAYLRAQYPHILFIEDGLPDDDNESIQYTDAGVKTFVLLHFSSPVLTGKGQSFATVRSAGREATLDVDVISREGTRARRFLNDLGDRLVGFKTQDGTRVREGGSLFAGSRKVEMEGDSPTRWMVTQSFVFGVSSKRTP